MKYVIYDIETTLTCFLVVLYDVNSGKKVCYKISKHKNDRLSLIKYLNSLIKRDYYFVGFNNLSFDAQIIHKILTEELTNYTDIYNESQRLINCSDDEKYKYLIPEWKLNTKNIDIMKIKGFDSSAKATSLKFLEFNLRMRSIEEIPFAHNISYTLEQEHALQEYCEYDVEATYFAFKELVIEAEINIRKETGKAFDVNIQNAAEPKMAKSIFVKELTKVLGKTKEELKEDKEKYANSFRYFKLNIPKYIEFENEELKTCLKYFENLTIDKYNTKNCVDYPIKVGNLTCYTGTGGIHGSISPQVIELKENEIIIDLDYVSYYPFLKIRNKFYPKYLSEKYLDSYYNFYVERKKHKKGTPLNYAFKILLNSSFGLLNEENSPIYDPVAFMNVTVSGQLILLMFMEKLLNACNNLLIISGNTDGTLLKIAKEDLEIVERISKEMTEITGIEIEHEFYKKVVVKDVNNYISINVDGSIKRKGLFEIRNDLYKTGLWNKNTSHNIIPLALQAYFVEGKDYKEFIRTHTNIYDFCAAVKKKSNFEILQHYYKNGKVKTTTCGKVTRYYVSKKGSFLIKSYHDGRESKIEAGYKTTILNRIVDENALNYDIDYSYYELAVAKIIQSIEDNNKQLTMF